MYALGEYRFSIEVTGTLDTLASWRLSVQYTGIYKMCHPFDYGKITDSISRSAIPCLIQNPCSLCHLYDIHTNTGTGKWKLH